MIRSNYKICTLLQQLSYSLSEHQLSSLCGTFQSRPAGAACLILTDVKQSLLYSCLFSFLLYFCRRSSRLYQKSGFLAHHCNLQQDENQSRLEVLHQWKLVLVAAVLWNTGSGKKLRCQSVECSVSAWSCMHLWHTGDVVGLNPAAPSWDNCILMDSFYTQVIFVTQRIIRQAGCASVLVCQHHDFDKEVICNLCSWKKFSCSSLRVAFNLSCWAQIFYITGWIPAINCCI